MRQKVLLFIALMFLFVSTAIAGTYTTNLTLYKPTVGETGWGAAVNANWDTLDDAHATAKPLGVEFYVDGDAGISGDLTIADDLTVEGEIFGISLREITEPTTPAPNTAYIFLDSGNDLKVKFDDGDVVTIGSY